MIAYLLNLVSYVLLVFVYACHVFLLARGRACVLIGQSPFLKLVFTSSRSFPFFS